MQMMHDLKLNHFWTSRYLHFTVCSEQSNDTVVVSRSMELNYETKNNLPCSHHIKIYQNDTMIAPHSKSVFGRLLRGLNGALDHYFWFCLLDFDNSDNVMYNVPSLWHQTSLSTDDYLLMLKECDLIVKEVSSIHINHDQWKGFLTINKILLWAQVK
jgi:hypothetical protein